MNWDTITKIAPPLSHKHWIFQMGIPRSFLKDPTSTRNNNVGICDITQKKLTLPEKQLNALIPRIRNKQKPSLVVIL